MNENSNSNEEDDYIDFLKPHVKKIIENREFKNDKNNKDEKTEVKASNSV